MQSIESPNVHSGFNNLPNVWDETDLENLKLTGRKLFEEKIRQMREHDGIEINSNKPFRIDLLVQK